jgi:hypothetical protein
MQEIWDMLENIHDRFTYDDRMDACLLLLLRNCRQYEQNTYNDWPNNAKTSTTQLCGIFIETVYEPA